MHNRTNVDCAAKGRVIMKTVEELITVWFHDYERSLIKPSSAACYYVHIYHHIIPGLGKYEVQELTEEILQKYFAGLSRDGKLKQEGGLSGKTIRDDRIILNSFLNNMKKKGIITENVSSDIRLPRRYNHEKRVLNRIEQRWLEDTVRQSGNNNSFGIILCLYTGIRIGELCALRLKDVDMERKMLYVRGTVQRIRNIGDSEKLTSVVWGTPKSASSLRDIPLPDSICPILERHLERRYAFAKADDALLCTRDGKYMEPRVYQKHFQYIVKQSGISDVNFHALRHTFATRALEAGMDYKTLSELLGHSSPAITMNIYAHSLPEQKRQAINLVGSIYET